MLLEVGTQVRLLESSEFYRQCLDSGGLPQEGIITDSDNAESRFNPEGFHYSIMWGDNGYSNNYRPRDIEEVLLTPEAIAAREERLREIEEEKRLEEERNRKISAELISNLNRIASDIYDDYEVQVKDDKILLICKLEDYTISNSHNKSVNIEEFYLIYTFKQNGRLCLRPCGFRSLYPYSHHKSEYAHSHLRGIPTHLQYEFCLGSTEVAVLVTDLMYDYDEDNLELLFYTMKEFVKWESLEGGPHRKIENITGDSNGDYIDIDDIEDVDNSYDAYINHVNLFPVQYKTGQYTSLLEVNRTSEEFINALSEVATVKVRFNTATGDYILRKQINPEHKVEYINQEADNNAPIFQYKGEDIKIKVYNDFVDDDTMSQLPLRAHPNIIEGVATKLEEELNNFIINEQYS